MMKRYFVLLLILAVMLPALPTASAQRVYSNSRAGNPFSGRGTGSFGIGTGQRWGTPAARGYRSPGNNSSSPDWTLRPTYNTSRSVTSRYDAALNGRSRASYSVRSPIHTYSSRGNRRSYSAYHGPVQYHPGYGHHHSHSYGNFGYGNFGYGNFGVINGFGPGIYNGFGYPVPTGIIAPPIVIPVLGNTTGFPPPTMQVQSQVIPPTFIPNSTMNAPQPALPPQQNVDAVSKPIPVDEAPIIDEFGRSVVVESADVSVADRIRSLRYQASGDSAFRKQDYASAEVFYRTASKTAPGRRAPRLRLAWSQVAQQRFAEAVDSVKKSLILKDDPTSSWVDGEDLYGRQSFVVQSDSHNEELWAWLQQRPNSTDRLLLAASFQQLRGYTGISNELLSAAASAGLQQPLIQSLRDVAKEQLQQDMKSLPQSPQPTATPIDDGGIRIHGTNAEPSSIGQPEPLMDDDDVPSVELPATRSLQLQPVDKAAVPSLAIPKQN